MESLRYSVSAASVFKRFNFLRARLKRLRENDKKWESILDNLKELRSPGSDTWCLNAGTYKQCVPDQLETHDGVPYKCLKRAGRGSSGEVLIYSRTDPNTGKEQKIAIKVMKYENDTECRNTSSYYNKFSENQWCPYVVVQKCITPKNGFDCDFMNIRVEVLAMELMEETLEEFKKNLPADTVAVVSKELLRKIYTALLCIWKNGAVYGDMKPENVMVNTSEPLENSFVKLVDLGSICTQIGSNNAVCTFPPPYTWATFNNGSSQSAARVACTEKTLIWSFAIAALSFYAPEAFTQLYHRGSLVTDMNLANINLWMKYIQSKFRKVKDEEGILDNVYKCFAPFGNKADWGNDWRLSKDPFESSWKTAPFTFNTMLEKLPKALSGRKEDDGEEKYPLDKSKDPDWGSAKRSSPPGARENRPGQFYTRPRRPRRRARRAWKKPPGGLGGALQRGGGHRGERPLCDKCGHELSCKYCS
ncbi:MAG: hypothetical protein KAJ19_29975 [Gammaproteobacteria bacterium]|nr:hypothetical protein [Gammaproteobacteria bacterium]